MANKLDDNDRDLLNFRPTIDYVEPEVQPGVIDPISEDVPQLEDLLEQRRKVARLANAVDVLSAFLQARADEKAKNMIIKLDPTVDAAAIQAVSRKYPGADPNQITYQQYRDCKDNMREAGLEAARKALVTPEQVDAVRDDATDVTPPSLGGFNTDAAKTGGLRPELNKQAQIVEPLNIMDIQMKLICILVDFIWKNFILKAFGIRIVTKKVSDLLPQKISKYFGPCKGLPDIDVPDLYILGEDVPEVLTQKPPNITETVPEITDEDKESSPDDYSGNPT